VESRALVHLRQLSHDDCGHGSPRPRVPRPTSEA
jgi:hypothetical protein